MGIFLSSEQQDQGKIILKLIKTVFIFGQGKNREHIVCFHFMVICLHFLQKCKLSYLFTVESGKDKKDNDDSMPALVVVAIVACVVVVCVVGCLCIYCIC